jgi:hypothetical protein
MNWINPALFQAAFTAWVRETWPGRPDMVAIDGKTSRRSQDRATGEAPIPLLRLCDDQPVGTRPGGGAGQGL